MALVAEEGQISKRVRVVVQVHCSLSYGYLSTRGRKLVLYPVGWLLVRGSPQERTKPSLPNESFSQNDCSHWIEKAKCSQITSLSQDHPEGSDDARYGGCFHHREPGSTERPTANHLSPEGGTSRQ
jgi:hypothetical protein